MEEFFGVCFVVDNSYLGTYPTEDMKGYWRGFERIISPLDGFPVMRRRCCRISSPVPKQKLGEVASRRLRSTLPTL